MDNLLYKKDLKTYVYHCDITNTDIRFKETVNGLYVQEDNNKYNLPICNFILRIAGGFELSEGIMYTTFDVYVKMDDDKLHRMKNHFEYKRGTKLDFHIENKLPYAAWLASNSDLILHYFEMYIRSLAIYNYGKDLNVVKIEEE